MSSKKSKLKDGFKIKNIVVKQNGKTVGTDKS